MKSVILFIVTFVVGAALALVVRTVRHQPYAEPASAAPAAASAADPHAGHNQQAPLAASPEPKGATTVNSVCAICGMDVNPSIKTAVYQGKTIGFGCAACPGTFAKDPDRYGPAALRNEVL